MTEHELLELLDRLGVNPGEWTEGGGHEAMPPTVEKQLKTLEKVRDLLQTGVDRDQVKLGHLKETLARMKYGGGS